MDTDEIIKAYESRINRPLIYNQKEEFKKRLKAIKKIGFDELIKNIKTSMNSGNLYSFITELNYIYQLYNELNTKNIDYNIKYELNTKSGNPDVKLTVNEVNYWIQIKRISKLKIDNINDKELKKIEGGLKKIKIGLFYSIDLNNNLENNDSEVIIENLLNSKKDIKDKSSIDIVLSNEKIDISFYFFKPNKKLEYLTRGSSTDPGRFISSEINKQLIGSFSKAIESLDNFDNRNINIIVADSYNNIELYDVENMIYELEREKSSNGISNTIISDKEKVIRKINYYILLNRKTQEVFTEYNKAMFIINDNKHSNIRNIMNIERIYYKNSDYYGFYQENGK